MASPALEPSAARERGGSVSDVAGALILGGCAGWALITAAGRDARPEGVLLAVLALGAGYSSGRIAGFLLPVGAPAAAALGALALALASPGTLPTAAAGAAALGRAGATAALLVLSVGAACTAAWATGRPWLRMTLRLLAAGATGAGALLGSPVGSAVAAGVLLCSLAAVRMRSRVVALAGLVLVSGCVTGATWAVAERGLPDGAADTVAGRLTGHRVEQWQDALGLAEEHPLLGSGPDTFAELSPAVRESAVTDGKPHSAPLQVAAEQGVPGVALLAGAYGWALLSLGNSSRPTPVVLTAAATLTAVAALASVSNALSFAAVTTGTGLLAGIATARRLTG